MDLFVILLRVIHIFASVFWAGATFMIYGFLEPTIRATGPEGGKVMQRLAQHSKLPTFMSLAALLATLAGILLYWRFSNGFQLSWITSAGGLALTIGSLAGIVTFLMGLVVMAPTAQRMGALGKQIQGAGGPPTPAQMAEMKALQGKLARGGLWSSALLAISVLTMSVARYI